MISAELPIRRPTRLPNYDYSTPGTYFVTICAKNRKHVFADYPILKEIAEADWMAIPARYKNVEIDEFIVMPDHIHGIIVIKPPVGEGFTPSRDDGAVVDERDGARPSPTNLCDIVGTFKSLCLKDWMKYIGENELQIRAKFWQRGFYYHVIRNDKDLTIIRHYIVNNP